MVHGGVEEFGQLVDEFVRVLVQGAQLLGHHEVLRVDVLWVKRLNPVDHVALLL